MKMEDEISVQLNNEDDDSEFEHIPERTVDHTLNKM